MNTRNVYTRTLMIFLLYSLIFSACSTPPDLHATAISAGSQVAEYAAAVQLMSSLPTITDGMVYGAQAGTSVWAINQAINSAPGAFTMVQEGGPIAVFIAPAARDAVTGNMHWFFSFVDCNTKSIISLCERLQCGNITSARTMADIEALLSKHGFQRIDPAEIPITVAVLRQAIRWIKATSLSVVTRANSISILAVPTYMLGTNPVIPSWTLAPTD